MHFCLAFAVVLVQDDADTLDMLVVLRHSLSDPFSKHAYQDYPNDGDYCQQYRTTDRISSVYRRQTVIAETFFVISLYETITEKTPTAFHFVPPYSKTVDNRL